MSNTAASHAPPVPLNPDNVDDLICSICMTIPVDPVITPCSHVFCSPCISQALHQNNLCPIDRKPCTLGQLKQLDGLSLRIWSGIQVKCGNHENGCAWRGPISDYSTHVENCTSGRNPTGHEAALLEELETLRQENVHLKEKSKNMLEAIKSLSKRPNLPSLFTGTYQFRRENVVQLSQLISRYLENKPREIDANKIYNCVRSCYLDFDKDYSDNPPHYTVDMRMLLATCLASTWFTANQMSNIRSWNWKHFGVQ